MLDWYQVGANSLWIGGCALALAVLSYAYSEAAVTGQRLGARLNQPGIRVLIHFSGLLWGLGLTATAQSGLERLLWVLWSLLFMGQIVLIFRQTEGKPKPPKS